MRDHEYKRHEQHDELAGRVDFNQQVKIIQAEIISIGLIHIGNGLFEIAAALKVSSKQPKWAKRLECKMTDASDALTRLNDNIAGLSDEIGQIAEVLANLPTSEDPAIAAGINEAADRLAAAKETLENATTLDDPAVEPDPVDPDPVDPDPVDPGNGDQPGDQPPVDQPPTV